MDSYSARHWLCGNECLCNILAWTVFSACGLCQGERATGWSQWLETCNNVTSTYGGYPLPLPQGVVLPRWAYDNFTKSGIFNFTRAQTQTVPEFSAVPGPSSTPTTTPTPTPTATPAFSPASSSSVPVSSNNRGAIVGGVIGGVLGIVLIAAIVLILVHRNKQNSPGQPSQANYDPSTVARPTSENLMGQYHHNAGAQATFGYIPYNPSNPSTFSRTPATTSFPTKSPPYSNQSQQLARKYSGAARI